MLRSALLILSGNAAASLLLLARNLVIARLIPVEDYGVAATFALVMAVVEMASAFGLQQQIVQAKEGDDLHFQAVLQGFQLLRGCLSGLAMLLLAGPLASFMGIPEVAWAYRLLAAVPVLNALQHFDIHRLNRHGTFGPMLLTGTLPALASLVAVWPLVHWLGDWRAALHAILIQAALGALVSHLLARRPWRLAFDRAVMAGSLRFGWPIMLNGVLMLLVFQGDRMIIGRELGMVPLAIFSMGLTLALTPTLILAKSVQNLTLRPLSQAHAEDRERFGRLAVAVQQLVLLLGLAFFLGFGLLAPPFVRAVLGEGYAPLLPLLALLALQQVLRVLKAGPALVALAGGRTANPMIANGVRACALPLCWLAAVTTGDLVTILWIGTGAELLGYVVAWALTREHFRGRLTLPHGVVAGLLAAGMLWFGQDGEAAQDWRVWLAVPAALGLCLAAMPELRLYARDRMRHR